MADDRTIELIIAANARRLENELRRSEGNIDKFGRRSSGVFGRVSRSFAKIGRGLASPLAGIATGAGILMVGKKLMDYQSRLTDFAIKAEMSVGQQMELEQRLKDSALATAKSRNELLAGIDIIVSKTGDAKFAVAVMDDIGIAATAASAEVAELGAFASQLNEKFKIDPSQIKEALNLILVQGKEGAFELRDLAAMGERLTAPAGRLDQIGMAAVRNVGALAQSARKSVSSAEEAATAVERALSSIIEKQGMIKNKLHVDVKDAAGKFKNLDAILKEIIIAAKGDERVLSKVFDIRGVRAVSAMARDFRETGGFFESFDKFVNADAGNQTAMMDDFIRKTGDAKVILRQLSSVAWEFADAALGPVLANITAELRALTNDPQKLEEFRQGIGRIGADIGTAAGNIQQIVTEIMKLLPLLKIIGWLSGGAARLVDTFTEPARFWVYQAKETKKYWIDPAARFASRQVEALREKYPRAAPGAGTPAFAGAGGQVDWERMSRLPALFAKAPAVRQADVNVEVNIDSAGRVSTKADTLNANTTVNAPTGPLVILEGE